MAILYDMPTAEDLQWFDYTITPSSGASTFNIPDCIVSGSTNPAFKTTSRIFLMEDSSNTDVKGYVSANITTNGTLTITFPKPITASHKISVGVSNARG